MTEEANPSVAQSARGATEGETQITYKARFARHLRKVLACLYDPAVLRGSPLVQLFDIQRDPGMASSLRRTVLQAIESLRPNEATPPGTKAWRVYQILRRRYTEQLTQREVASALGLSTRQLQREEKLARQVLVDHLWVAHSLSERAHLLDEAASQPGGPAPADPEPGAQILTRTQELAFLKDSVPAKDANLHQVIQQVIETIDPLRESLDVSIVYTPGQDLPLLRLQAPILRQALLNLINIAISYAPRQIEIWTDAQPRQIHVHIQAMAGPCTTPQAPEEHAESLEMARQLVQLCRGELHVSSNLEDLSSDRTVPLTAQITLQAQDQIPVLVIDDNEDVLRLFRRYMSGSRYRFAGAQSAQQGLAQAQELAPKIIVLDVMMPEQDGWTLLGLLREHPQTINIPVIVCTILPQEQLALTLGADEFIRKPVSRSALLAALDRRSDATARKASTAAS